MMALKGRTVFPSQDNEMAELDGSVLQQYIQTVCNETDLSKESLEDCRAMLKQLYQFGFLQPNRSDDNLADEDGKASSFKNTQQNDLIDYATDQYIQSIHSDHRNFSEEGLLYFRGSLKSYDYFGVPQFGTCNGNLTVIKDLLDTVGPGSFKIITVAVTAFYKHQLFRGGHYGEDYLHSSRIDYFMPRDRSLKPFATIVNAFLQPLQLKNSPLVKNIDTIVITLLAMQYYCCAREEYGGSLNQDEIDGFIKLAETGNSQLCLTVFSGLLPFMCRSGKSSQRRSHADKVIKQGDYRALLCKPPLNNMEKIALMGMEFLNPHYAHNSRRLLTTIVKHRNPRSYLRAIIRIFTMEYNKNLAQGGFTKDYYVGDICRHKVHLLHLSSQEQKIYCIQKDTFSSILKMGDDCICTTDFILYHHLRNKRSDSPRSARIIALFRQQRATLPAVKSFCSAELEACAIELTIDDKYQLPMKFQRKELLKYIDANPGLATTVLIAHQADELGWLMWSMIIESPLQALYSAYMICKQKQIISVWEQCRADIDAIDRLARSAQILCEFFGNDSAMIILHYVSMSSYFCASGFFGRSAWQHDKQSTMAEALYFAMMRDRRIVSKILTAYQQEYEKSYRLGCVTVYKHWKKSTWDFDCPENQTFYQLYKRAATNSFFGSTTANVFKETFGIDCHKENKLTTVITSILKPS
ncbi:MAG: hypothetical protein GY821_00375 [Gammaproteobacteria bacterium]|nr:hypothetical protein [Gammaproteobacteria bacterium]